MGVNWDDEIARVLCTLKGAEGENDDVVTPENLQEIWRRIRAALSRALAPHPEVQLTVLHELEVEFAYRPAT